MNHFVFFLNYAMNRLRHGGQRVVITFLAITFGVMSLITMSSVADAIESTLTSDPRVMFGGDLLASRQDGQFTLQDTASFKELQAAGTIHAFSPGSESLSLLLRTETNGQGRYFQRGLGIDAAVYPVVGNFAVAPTEAGSVSPADLLRNVGSALITSDLALQFNVKIGDRLRIAESDGTALEQVLTITGIVTNTPTHIGDRLFYSLETAQALFERPNVFDYMVVRTENAEAAAAKLQAAGWRVDLPPAPPPEKNFFKDVFTFENLFDFMLRGAGVLGLLVGGIGIANTMQVMLAQRRKEVGILKTLGYSQTDMILIFLLETSVLGMLGSIFGALLSIAVGRGIVQLFANVIHVLIGWQFNPLLTVSGIILGVVTTTLFAFYAIVRASRIRPSVIFRQETGGAEQKRQWAQALGFYALLSIPFAVVTTFIMKSVISGVGIIVLSIVGAIGFSIMLGISTWVVLRILPTFGSKFLRMGRNNMRKRAWSMLFAMIALFVGIFTVGFAITIVQVGIDQLAARQDRSVSQNLMVYTDVATAPQIEQTLTAQGITSVNARYSTHVAALNGDTSEVYDFTLQGRDSAWDFAVTEGMPFFNEIGGVYISEDIPTVKVGDEYTIQFKDGTTKTLPVVGRYQIIVSGSLLVATDAPLVSHATLTSLGITDPQINVYAIVDQSKEASLAQQIGTQFPNSMTRTRSDVLNAINRVFTNLLIFALAMAGLALLAGVMLMANVVSLAMIERRFEIGVMKTVGYTQQQIFTLLLMEYSLVGFIASFIGVVGVQAVILLFATLQPTARGILIMNPLTAVLIIVFGVVLTLITALVSAWKPAHVRPLLILNEQAS